MPTNARGKFPNKTPEDYLLEEGDLASNPETRTPVIICVDCSYSMRQQQRLDRVLEGLDTFCRDMERDPIARDSVELCLISYGGSMARVERDFATPDRLLEQGLPKLAAAGATPLADAVLTALENLELRKRRYRDNGITWYRPWLILIGDGDESQSPKELLLAADRLKEESGAKHLSVLCITVGDEQRMECASLLRLPPDGRVQYLRDMKFREFFAWLSRSIEKTSQSMSGEEARYEPTATWGEVLERPQE